MQSLNCFGCGKIVSPKDLILTINASAGPRIDLKIREHPIWSWASYPTTTAHVAVCRGCLDDPAMAGLLELISPPLSKRAGTAGRRCVILCRGRDPMFWFAGLRSRLHFWPSTGLHRCPGCGKSGVLWPAPMAPEQYLREVSKMNPGEGVPRKISIRPRPAARGALPQGMTEDAYLSQRRAELD